MNKYEKLLCIGNSLQPVSELTVTNKLSPGMYTAHLNRNGELFFSRMKSNYDQLIDLPNTEYDTVMKEIDRFLSNETKNLFDQFGFLYKYSALLEGPPGSGKTCIVNRAAEKVVADGGIVFFNPDPRLLVEVFTAMDCLQPNDKVMVIFEELDQLVARYEDELLNILDGEVQKRNVIYVGTTNYIDKIPARIRRPGRFSTIMHVDFPNTDTRRFYLESKVGKDHPLLTSWVEKTYEFSIDELRDTVRAVCCFDQELDYIVDRIRKNKVVNDQHIHHNSEDLWDEDRQYKDLKFVKKK